MFGNKEASRPSGAKKFQGLDFCSLKPGCRVVFFSFKEILFSFSSLNASLNDGYFF